MYYETNGPAEYEPYKPTDPPCCKLAKLLMGTSLGAAMPGQDVTLFLSHIDTGVRPCVFFRTAALSVQIWYISEEHGEVGGAYVTPDTFTHCFLLFYRGQTC